MTEHSTTVGGSSAARVLACPGSVVLNQKVAAQHKQRVLDLIGRRWQQEVILRELLAGDGRPDSDMTLADALPVTVAKVEGVWQERHGSEPRLTLDAAPQVLLDLVEAQYREETTSEYAQEGTDLHSAMEWLLLEGEEPETVADRTFGKTHITPTLFSEAILPAMEEFDRYLDRVLDEDGEEMDFKVEVRGEIPGVPGAFGTTDIAGRTSKRLLIWDWKFGAGVKVGAEDNKQGKFYGRALCYTLQDWLGFPLDPDTNQFDKNLRIDIAICQPRIGDGEVDIWTTSYGELEAFRMDLVRAMAEALGDNPTFRQGDHCRWCEAKHICPAKQQLMTRVLERIDNGAEHAADATDTDIEDVSVSAAVMHAVTTEFTPDDLAEWLREADEVEEWAKGVRSLARSELDAGREVTGKALDQRLGNASWTDDEDKIDARLGRYGLSVSERRVVNTISPTVARKLLKGDEKHAALLEKVIHRPLGKVVMVDADAVKNPPVSVSETVASVGARVKEHLAKQAKSD